MRNLASRQCRHYIRAGNRRNTTYAGRTTSLLSTKAIRPIRNGFAGLQSDKAKAPVLTHTIFFGDEINSVE
jgi:hypothetical protein